ncbi:MAG: hypothetical protein JST55_14510 [Bacteroidetes bacterium]|nr:hypothetical protein [Bacteroidota bacterium]
MELKTLKLNEFFNEDNLKYLDTLTDKFLKVKNIIQQTSDSADEFVSSFSLNDDDPRKRIRELEKKRKETIAEMNKLIEDWMFDTGMSAVAEFGGEEGKFAAIITTLVKKSITSNVEIREMGDDFHNRDNTNVAPKEPILNPVPYFEQQGLDTNNVDFNDPKWKEYFQRKYKEWQEYNAKHPVKKYAQDGEDIDFDTILSMISYLSESVAPYIELYDTGKKVLKGRELDKTIEEIDEELENLKKKINENEGKDENKRGPSDPSKGPSQRLPNNQGAGNKNVETTTTNLNNYTKTSYGSFNTEYEERPSIIQIYKTEHREKNLAGGAKQNKGPDPYQVFEQAYGEAQKLGGSLRTIMNNLHIGADTFVGQLIDGFGTALTVIETILAAIQAAQAASGLFGFLKTGLSFIPGIGPVAAAAVSAVGPKAGGGMVWGGSTYLVGEHGMELFTPNVTGSITSHREILQLAGNVKPQPPVIHTVREPYIVTTSIRGTDLKLSLQRTENRIGRERS